jgi:hypothetical protein
MRDWSLFHWLVLALFLYLLWLALRPRKKASQADLESAAQAVTAPAATAGAETPTAATPPLWNPNAAANWSLVFTPIFGAILLSKNWTALRELKRSKGTIAWSIITPLVVIAIAILGGARARGIVSVVQGFLYFSYIVLWYYVSVRPQAKYVKVKCGNDYPRKRWGIPLIIAFVILVIFRNLDRYVFASAA